MLTSLIKPKILWFGLIVQTIVLIVVFSNILIKGTGKLDNFAVYFPAIMEILIYFLAGVLNFRISAEYKNNRLMRWAWIFLGLNAFVSTSRAVVQLPIWNLVSAGYYNSAFEEQIHQIIILTANLFLLLGLSVMWLGFRETNLGFTIGRRGYIEIAFIIILTTALLLTVNDPFPIGLVILSAASIVSVILHKIALQMGGGKLALALGVLTLYALMRAIFVLIEHSLGLNDVVRRQNIDLMMAIDLIVWRFIAWIAALAAAYRAELTVHATRELIKGESEVARAAV